MNNIDWLKGKPEFSGLHFVAVKYGEGAGTFDFVEWDGNKWLTEYEGSVIAYTTLEGLIRGASFNWPEATEDKKETHENKNIDTDGLWEEM